MISDAMFFHQRDEVLRRVAGKRRFAKVRIGGEIILRIGIKVGEVATSAAGNLYLLANAISVFDEQHPASALPCFDSAKQTRRAAANDNDIFRLVQSVNLSAKSYGELPLRATLALPCGLVPLRETGSRQAAT